MKLLDVLNNRYSIAKKFTEKYTKEVKTCLEDYKCEKVNGLNEKTDITDRHVKSKRYKLPIPYIYSTHESMMSSLFEKAPELVITDKGEQDEEKAEKIKAAYKYLYDKLDLDDFLVNSAWWIILTGFVSSYQTYEMKISGMQNVLDSQGNPMFDEMTGEPVTSPVFEYNDPATYVDDPFKTYFAPESEFTVKGDKIPYVIREKLMDKYELTRIYDNIKPDELEANEKIEVVGYKENGTEAKSDLMRVKTLYYCGVLPEDIEDAPENWKPETKYYIAYTPNKILNISEETKKNAIAKWFGSPIDFFGFGIGKTLRTFQKEMSIRRGQQIRYADLHSFPKPIVDSKTKLDQVAMNELGKADSTTPLIYNGNPPAYLTPPPLPEIMMQMDNMARSDAQFVSGTLDLSKGAQETNTVKTATGQQLFAQSQDKRIQKLRKALGKYFKYVVVNLLELARDNWDEQRLIKITDEEGEEKEVGVSKYDLHDVDFDTDIDIQLDTITVNKDTLAQRSVEMYDKVKDDPLVNRRKVFAKMLKDGYNLKNPEGYMLEEGQEGSQPTGNTMKDGIATMAAANKEQQLANESMGEMPEEQPVDETSNTMPTGENTNIPSGEPHIPNLV